MATETVTIQSDAIIVDPTQFEYDTSQTFLESPAITGDTFDIKLKHVCDHNLSEGQFTLTTCTRCLGTGYYYDIKFNEIGKPFLVSLEDKLQQSLEKIVLTEENKFHEDIAVNLKKWLGAAPISEISTIIEYEIIKSLATLQENQKGVKGLSPRAQISSINNINVSTLGIDSLQYVITLTAVSGEIINLRGKVRLNDIRLTD